MGEGRGARVGGEDSGPHCLGREKGYLFGDKNMVLVSDKPGVPSSAIYWLFAVGKSPTPLSEPQFL